MTQNSKLKQIMLIHRRAPYGTIYAQEGLDVALLAAAFEQDLSLAFIGDGVFQLKRGQDAGALSMKTFTKAFRALGDYGVRHLYVEAESLRMRGLQAADLLPINLTDDTRPTSIEILPKADLARVVAQQHVLLNF